MQKNNMPKEKRIRLLKGRIKMFIPLPHHLLLSINQIKQYLKTILLTKEKLYKKI